jgi:hypothetical protein
MTIAEFISPEQTETLMTDLADSVSPGSFRCAALNAFALTIPRAEDRRAHCAQLATALMIGPVRAEGSLNGRNFAGRGYWMADPRSRRCDYSVKTVSVRF